jgi:hypothetical protein
MTPFVDAPGFEPTTLWLQAERFIHRATAAHSYRSVDISRLSLGPPELSFYLSFLTTYPKLSLNMAEGGREHVQKKFDKFLISPPFPAEALPFALGETGPPLPEGVASAFRAVDEAASAAKRELDPFEKDPQLSAVLRAVDLYAGLKRLIVHDYGGQVVTNAWLKMFEIVTQMGLFEAARVFRAEESLIRVFCNAELPGAFVCALNHYACSWFPHTRFDWVASSLYPAPPEKEGAAGSDVLGDYYGLYECNRERWLMGPDMVGDITDAVCIRELVRRAQSRLGEVDLYTSDAGIDVSADYGRQEELTARINLGQIVTGLLVLRTGGAFVVKTYTFVHPFSVSLAGVCASLFESFFVTKPKTSRPTNSEVYFVGIGYRGAPPEVASRLLEGVTYFDYGRALFPIGRPESEYFVLSLLAAGQHIHQKQQAAFLKEAVLLYKKAAGKKGGVGALRATLKRAAGLAVKGWLHENPVGALGPECRLRVKKGGGC